MSRKSIGPGVMLFASFFMAPPITLGGSVSPVQIEQVVSVTSMDPLTGQFNSDTTETADPVSSFVLSDLRNSTIFTGFLTEALVEYQGNPGSVVLDVKYAAWNNDFGDSSPVPIYVYSFPTSPVPSQFGIQSLETPVATFAITPGDYSSSPLGITLDGTNTTGSVWFLLMTEATRPDGAPYLVLAAVPEPSSFLTLAVGALGVAMACAWRVRGRFFPAVRASVGGTRSKVPVDL
jgi:PEP-CTERM motif